MYLLRCIVCHEPFDFARGEVATVLRHVAYGFDFVHERHAAIALEWVFVDPDYDRPAFGYDERRLRFHDAATAGGWTVALPEPPEQIAAGNLVHFEPLRLWVSVEHRDGSLDSEGLIRDAEWETEPGGAEFPEGECGRREAVGYVPPGTPLDPTDKQWESIVHARYRGERVPPHRNVLPLPLRRQSAAA
jgi:hypothetical protein